MSSIFSRRLLTTTCNVTLGNYKYWDEANEIDLNAYYQRDYVWGEQEQQEFLFSIFNNLPLGTIAVINKDTYIEGVPNYEIVDGKQRITTVLMYLKGEIGYKFKGKYYYIEDLGIVDKRPLMNKTMPYQQLYHGITEHDKLDYFYRINFTGVPQSEEHRRKIKGIMDE